MDKLFLTLIIFLFGAMLVSCDPPVQQQAETQPDLVSEQFVKANQYMQRRHQDHISAFLERVGWEAEVTSSGLWIVVEKAGDGKRIEENSRVTFTFESTLLDGTPCYSAGDADPKAITIGKGGVESGVEQGMKRVSEGSEAIFLIPPHLGHGNFGDRNRIPGNTVLIYRIRILKVE